MFPQFVMHIGVGGDRGADIDADGSGVDQFDMFDAVRLDGEYMLRKFFPLNLRVQAGYQAFQDQGRLAGTGYSGYHGQFPFGNPDFQWFYCVNGAGGEPDDPVMVQICPSFFFCNVFCIGVFGSMPGRPCGQKGSDPGIRISGKI